MHLLEEAHQSFVVVGGGRLASRPVDCDGSGSVAETGQGRSKRSVPFSSWTACHVRGFRVQVLSMNRSNSSTASRITWPNPTAIPQKPSNLHSFYLSFLENMSNSWGWGGAGMAGVGWLRPKPPSPAPVFGAAPPRPGARPWPGPAGARAHWLQAGTCFVFFVFLVWCVCDFIYVYVYNIYIYI